MHVKGDCAITALSKWGDSPPYVRMYGDWLKRALDAAGRSHEELAEVLGIDRTAVSKIVANKRALKADEMMRAAQFLAARLPTRQVPVRGYVGAGAEVIMFEDDADIEHIATLYMGGEASAVRVLGDSMYPYIGAGSLILHGEPIAPEDAPSGRQYIVRLADGKTFAKVLRRGSEPGRWNLESPNAPTLENVDVEWVAPIVFIDFVN